MRSRETSFAPSLYRVSTDTLIQKVMIELTYIVWEVFLAEGEARFP